VKIKQLQSRFRLSPWVVCLAVMSAGIVGVANWVRDASAAPPRWCCRKPAMGHGHITDLVYDESGPGTWYWVRSPEQEQRVVASLFARYCVRCHGVDGRGIWDMPDVPNFTNLRWQASRSDQQLARIIVEGRGAVMPSFRGTLSLEEAWAMARHLRSFSPDALVSRPDLTESDEPTGVKEKPKSPKK
jgi:hypothetical protein